MKRSATFVSMLLCSCVAQAEDPACYPIEDFALGGVVLHSDLNAVKQARGNPQSTATSEAEDDGGQYQITSLFYPTIAVDVGADFRGVERIVTESSAEVLASGVAVGMPRSKVLEILRMPDAITATPLVRQVTACNAGEVELTFSFASDRLHKIEVTGYGP